jgi:predicted lipid-binding transport protein (Tim44 family)
VAAVSSVPSSELEKRPVQTPDPHDEPSAEWGWHGTLPKGARLGGIFVTLVLFGMLIGNQTGHVEDFYLVITGVIMIVMLLLSGRRRRRAWRR